MLKDANAESESAFASAAGVNRGSLNRILRAHGNKPSAPRSAEVLAKVATRYDVSIEWLIYGVGEPRLNAYDALDRVLSERARAPAAESAARTQREGGAQLTPDGWRRFLRNVEIAVEAAMDGISLQPPEKT